MARQGYPVLILFLDRIFVPVLIVTQMLRNLFVCFFLSFFALSEFALSEFALSV